MPIMPIELLLKQIATNGLLTGSESEELFSFIAQTPQEQLPQELLAAYLYSTSIRTLTKGEIVGAVKAMRNAMNKLPMRPLASASHTVSPLMLDTCGTGGSGLNSFNVSTASAFVLATSGIKVAKHGNRKASSTSGSADLLEAIGIRIDCSPEAVVRCIESYNFGFMFAPLYHPAAGKVAPLRKLLGVRTIFNYLGPLLNPASVTHQVLGVSNPLLLHTVAESLQALGIKRALVVRSDDGLDEISLSTSTKAIDVTPEHISEFIITPEDVALKRRSPEEYMPINSAEDSAKVMRKIFFGDDCPEADLVALNAAAGLYITGRAATIREGVVIAKGIIQSGNIMATIEGVKGISNGQ